MKISLSVIKQLVGSELPPIDELVDRINQRLGQVEEVIDVATHYRDAIIVRVVTTAKHENADALTVCTIDDGGVRENVERDGSGYVQVVCGAPNVKEGMMTVWLPPSATVPSTVQDDEPFVLQSRALRGVVSHGMLAAADELGIGTDHNGIVSLSQTDLSPDSEIRELRPGQKFADVFGLNDYCIDIENKMFTHRPDCFGHIGVAREIAGIMHRPFKSPEWYRSLPSLSGGEGLPLGVNHEAKDRVPRFMAVALTNIKVSESPMWLKCALVAMGSKPINSVVDITNYMMLMTAQPTHAYDYDKLHGAMIGTRMAKKGESLELLNDKTYKLDENDVVIVDGERAIGLAGIMGGLDTEVSDETTSVVIECAVFDMYTIRKTSMRHGLFTDAVTRFTKGQSPLQTPRVLAHIVAEMIAVTGAVQASDYRDSMSENVAKRIAVDEGASLLIVAPDFVRSRLGIPLKKYEMVQLLQNVEFEPCEDCGWNPDDEQDNVDDWHISVPFWRTDVEQPEDVVEEIGRLYGFDALPRELPSRSITPAPINYMLSMSQKIRDSFARMGANEVLTYSFVHENTLKKTGQDTENAFRLSNALSPDLQYYRLSVLPSLLDKVHMNIRAGYDEFALFEIGKGHSKRLDVDNNGLPVEPLHADMIYASKNPKSGAAYYQAKQMLDQLASDFGIAIRIRSIEGGVDGDVEAPFDHERSGRIVSADGIELGIVGELKSTVRIAFKLPEYAAALSINLRQWADAARNSRCGYIPLSKYPSATRDISLKVDCEVSYSEVIAILDPIIDRLKPLNISILPLSIFAPDNSSNKTITLRFVMTSYDHTLTDQEIVGVMNAAKDALSRGINAVFE